MTRPITAADQAYYSYYHLDSARAKGYTGAGVTIAIIDGSVDTSVPELAGANITDKSPCSVTSSSATEATAQRSLPYWCQTLTGRYPMPRYSLTKASMTPAMRGTIAR